MKRNNVYSKLGMLLMSLLLIIGTLALPASVNAEQADPQLDWVEGHSQEVLLGDIAKLTLPENYFFLDADNTIAMLEAIKEIPTQSEIGYIEPAAEDQNWVVYFEYEESGHISDEDKADIDADDLLKSYRTGQKEANKQLPEDRQLSIEGWFAPPHYDESLRSLTWALLLKDSQGEPFINYNSRILTRLGYISVILVSDEDHLDADRKVLEAEILPSLTPVSGQAYTDYDPSIDKSSSTGLSGLILGGAGLVVAKKAGLISILLVVIKKFWFFIIIPFAWLFRKLRGKNKNNDQAPETFSPDATASTQAQNVSSTPEEDRFKSKFDIEKERKEPPTSM
ncbi:DUF2167 domain-containing protein [Paenibacillus sanguinis]|uniref:DUF2167 domain-containing protein n=1 Tax=Paenibacillus sanguinis TaxID=225906 RepID=UPI00037EB660|nr:DUF2167 domain-containing protein [Paenibacillus sanguinis]